MFWFAFYIAAILLAYRVGRNGAGYGVAVLIAAVAVHQMTVDGPASFIGGGDCVRYGSRADNC